MRVLVCGGRHYDDYPALKYVLDHSALGPTSELTVIHGDALGADRLAGKWAKEVGAKVEAYPADWGGLGGRAGPIRNRQMIDEGRPDLVIAFAGGKGTADMMRQAKVAGIRVDRISNER
jgi:hypothetical protein